jgi:hypothetical protein
VNIDHDSPARTPNVAHARRLLRQRIAAEEGLRFTLARIYSEQPTDRLIDALNAGRIHPLTPELPLDAAALRSCTHIVGLMGHEPITDALDRGADVVLAGRSSDTSLVVAVALRAGLPAGPAWHAAKTVECGDQCTTRPRGEGVIVTIDRDGFTVAPLDPEAVCTPTSVAAHMLYENADPFRLREPSGTLDTSAASYARCGERGVRVSGSRFAHAAQATIKLEGSTPVGYETMSFVGIADPQILEAIDAWIAALDQRLRARVRDLLGLKPEDYAVQLRCYGRNAILGPLAANGAAAPHEVGVMMRVRAADQATAIAKTANPLLLHQPLAGMEHLPSFAFATSPAELERGVLTIGQLAEEVRSKNAGPFWMTLDIFLRNDADYEYLLASGQLSEEHIGRLYEVDRGSVQIFTLPAIRAIKISFPRSVSAGSFEDRDQHAGQQHIPLSRVPLPCVAPRTTTRTL